MTVRVISKTTGVEGEQFLVFRRGRESIEVPVRNGAHVEGRDRAQELHHFTISRTWRSGVEIRSLKHRCAYRALR